MDLFLTLIPPETLPLVHRSCLRGVLDAVGIVQYDIAPCRRRFPVAAVHKVKPCVFAVVARPGPGQIAYAFGLGLLHDLIRVNGGAQIVVAIIVVVAKLAHDDSQPLVLHSLQLGADLAGIIVVGVHMDGEQQIMVGIMLQQLNAMGLNRGSILSPTGAVDHNRIRQACVAQRGDGRFVSVPPCGIGEVVVTPLIRDIHEYVFLVIGQYLFTAG